MACEKVKAGETQNYFAYLLRLWRESGGDLPRDESTRWRASLQDPHSGERVGFANLEDLFAFLERETRFSLPESECLKEEVIGVTDNESRGNEAKV
jgi:hypothetical protein